MANPPLDYSHPSPETPDDKGRPALDANDEKVYYKGSPLLRGEVGMVCLFGGIGLLLILIPILMGVFGEYWLPWWVMLLLFVIAVLMFGLPILYTKRITYRISNFRIDYERGLLSKTIDTLELWHVDDITFHQSVLDRILNVGTITINSSDKSTPKLLLRGLPDARQLFDTLKQRVINIKRQRSVIKIDPG